jgi:hypothetical protein
MGYDNEHYVGGSRVWVRVVFGRTGAHIVDREVRFRAHSRTAVGVVAKRFAGKSLPPGRLIALAGEAGFQADTLAPGLHFGY